MLSGNFFTISSIGLQPGRVEALLEVNSSHDIFTGHFPGQPVVPGVCMMQMVKEILETALGFKTRLANADQMKFLTILNPLESNHVSTEIKYAPGDDDQYKVSATIFTGSVIYFKMRGVFYKEIELSVSL